MFRLKSSIFLIEGGLRRGISLPTGAPTVYTSERNENVYHPIFYVLPASIHITTW